MLPSSAYFNVGEEKAETFKPSDPVESIQSPAHIWNELGVLIPFLDMVNHEVDAQCLLWQQNEPTDDGDADATVEEDPSKQTTTLTKANASSSNKRR